MKISPRCEKRPSRRKLPQVGKENVTPIYTFRSSAMHRRKHFASLSVVAACLLTNQRHRFSRDFFTTVVLRTMNGFTIDQFGTLVLLLRGKYLTSVKKERYL